MFLIIPVVVCNWNVKICVQTVVWAVVHDATTKDQNTVLGTRYNLKIIQGLSKTHDS